MNTDERATVNGNDEDEIVVSVLTPCYNHEKYIRKCIESIISQKTNFKFELLINDDASTDDSAKIIKEYEEKYPDIVKPVYQTENQYSKGVKITAKILVPRAKGKYFAFCEGDDYWTDENKLQKQVDALESHPECRFCTHRVQIVRENDEEIPYAFFPSFPLKSGIIGPETVISWYNFQTCSFFFKKSEFLNFLNQPRRYRDVSIVGDLPMLLFAVENGEAYYFDEVMSHYRKGSVSSVNTTASKKQRIRFFENMIEVLEEFDKYTDGRFRKAVKKRIKREEFCLNKVDGSKRKMPFRAFRYFLNHVGNYVSVRLKYDKSGKRK